MKKIYRMSNDKQVNVGDTVRSHVGATFKVVEFRDGTMVCKPAGGGRNEVSEPKAFQCYLEGQPPSEKESNTAKLDAAKKKLWDYYTKM